MAVGDGVSLFRKFKTIVKCNDWLADLHDSLLDFVIIPKNSYR